MKFTTETTKHRQGFSWNNRLVFLKVRICSVSKAFCRLAPPFYTTLDTIFQKPGSKHSDPPAALCQSAAGEPINGYIKKAIDDRMEREAAGSRATQQTPEPQSPKQPAEKPEKHFKPFTEEDARRIDLPELLKNVRYQIDISGTFGMDVLAALMEKAREQSTVT